LNEERFILAWNFYASNRTLAFTIYRVTAEEKFCALFLYFHAPVQAVFSSVPGVPACLTAGSTNPEA